MPKHTYRCLDTPGTGWDKFPSDWAVETGQNREFQLAEIHLQVYIKRLYSQKSKVRMGEMATESLIAVMLPKSCQFLA